MLEYKNILGIILARGNSKGIKNKNLLKLKNKSLIDIAIKNSKKSKKIGKLVFTSDSQNLINKVKNKIDICIKRPKRLATDTASSYDVARHAVNWVQKNLNWNVDIVVILPPTTPFRKSIDIDKTIDLLFKKKTNSAITITEPTYTPYWMFTKNKKICKFLRPEGQKIQRRQDAPKAFQPAGMVYAIKKNLLFNMKGILPKKNTATYFVDKERAVNIDNMDDYNLAKIKLKKFTI